FFQSAQTFPPRSFGGAAVPAGQPLQIIAEWGDPRQSSSVARIQLPQFGNHQRHGPSIQQDVMGSNQKAEFFLSKTDQKEPKQGSNAGIEADVTVLLNKLRPFPFLFRFFQHGKIQVFPWQGFLTGYNLHRPLQAFMLKSDAQMLVTVQP